MSQTMRRLDPLLIRSVDLLFALGLLIVLAIPMAVIALMIRAEDRGPALFVQRRVGKGGRAFEILKFRTMRVNPVSGSGRVEGSGPAALAEARSRFQTTTANDPRITRIGGPLRAMHLDELPQVINVLAGHMSVVGVRPDTPAQEADYAPAYWIERHRLRPGITGPAQLYNVSSLDERTRLERLWLRDPTFRAYIHALVGTVGKVLRRSGV